jgi:outer membrane protein
MRREPTSQSGPIPNFFRSRRLIKVIKPFSHGLCLSVILLSFLTGLAFPSTAQTQDQGQVLTLQQAIDLGLKSQPSIKAGRYTVRAGEARIGEAQSSFYPQVNSSGSYSRNYPPAAGTRVVTSSSTGTGGSTGITSGSASTGAYDSYTGSVGLNQMIYDFGKASTQVRISKSNTESARYDLANTQQTVVFNVKQAYYNVLQTARNRDVVQQSVNQFQQHLEQARGFYEVGTKAKFDVTKAEVDLSNARVTLIAAENQANLAMVALKNAIGNPDAPDYRLDKNLLRTKYEVPFEQALQKAYAQRPDLQSLSKKRESSKESIALAQKGYYPVINGNANYYYTGSDFPLRDGWSYGMSISVPIFSGFLTRRQVDEAQSNYGVISANEESLRLDIYSQVQQAYLSLRAADEGISATELGVRQAKENVELVTGRYDAGIGSPLEVTDAIVAQAKAEVAYTAALVDYKNAQAAIEKAIGERP